VFKKKSSTPQNSFSEKKNGWNRAEYQWGIKQERSGEKALVWMDENTKLDIF